MRLSAFHSFVLVHRSSPQVKQFCDSIEHLKSMGFKENIICGALLKHNGDVSAAITTCLDGS